MTPLLPTAGSLYSRIGVVGDIHTAVDRLEWALATLREQKVGLICATGDIVDGPYTGAAVIRCCELLREHGIMTVAGNHDRWLLDGEHRDLDGTTFPEDIDRTTREYLQHLPVSVELQTPRGLLLLGHGLGSDDMCSLFPYDHGPALRNNATLQRLIKRPRYRYVVGGHTHHRMVRQIDGVTFINAGAIEHTREPCCVVLDFVNNDAQFFDQTSTGATAIGPHFSLTQSTI